jgi:hypothetical protein
MGVDMASAVAVLMAGRVVGAAVARMSLAGMAVAVTGAVATGMAVVAAGTMVVTAAAGELAPRLASVLALDYSEEH